MSESQDTQNLVPLPPEGGGHKKNYLGYAIAAAAVILLAYLWMKNYQVAKPESSAQKIVVLNTSKIITGSTKQIMESKDLTNEQISAVSSKLADNLHKVIVQYREQGYVVMNSNALVAWPDDIDVTAKVADTLGVKID